jgi:DNA-binding transcriptional LysR family regulator
MTKETDWTARIGRRLRLRDLHILLAVAKTGSIGKAAAELAISQPVVSKAMSDLEHSLGVRLFDRGSKGVEPTRHGRALLKTAVVVFDELRQGVDTLEFLSDPTVGELRLGCTEPLAAGFVGAVIESLARDLPRVSFNVVTGDPLALTERELQQRNIELAVTPSEGLGRAGDIDVESLFDDRQVIAAGPDNKWTRRRSIAFAELAKERWILPPPDTIIGSQIAAAFRAAGLEPPRSQIESFSIPLCLRLVATGRFITMLPMSMVMLGRSPPLKLLRLDTPPVPRPTAIITLRDRTRSAVANIFIDRARKMAERFASIRKS